MKTLWLTATIVLSISGLCYAEIGLPQLYQLREKEALQQFVAENEGKSDASDVKKLKMLGIAYHNLAVLKIKGASKKSAEYLQKAQSLSPGDDEVQAYLGSATTMVGRDSWNMLSKINGVNKGIKIMDEAVAKSPDDVIIRMVRANNSLELPDLFKRKDIAKKDFEHVEMLMTKSSPEVDPATQAEVFYQLGMGYQREGNVVISREYFKKAVNASADSFWGKEAERRLQP